MAFFASRQRCSTSGSIVRASRSRAAMPSMVLHNDKNRALHCCSVMLLQVEVTVVCAVEFPQDVEHLEHHSLVPAHYAPSGGCHTPVFHFVSSLKLSLPRGHTPHFNTSCHTNSKNTDLNSTQSTTRHPCSSPTTTNLFTDLPIDTDSSVNCAACDSRAAYGKRHANQGYV